MVPDIAYAAGLKGLEFRQATGGIPEKVSHTIGVVVERFQGNADFVC